MDLANSVLTTVTWTAYYATTADSFGTLASPTRTQIATGTFTVTSTITRYSASISVPAAATTGIEIVFSVGAQTSGTWTIGNVQLEAGTVATPLERRSHGLELALCQRYFFKTYDPNTPPGTVTTNGCTIGTANGATARPTVNVFFPVSMRAAPTVSLYSPGTGALGAVRNVDAPVDHAGVVLYAGSNGTIWYPNATPSASNSITAHVTASSEL